MDFSFAISYPYCFLLGRCGHIRDKILNFWAGQAADQTADNYSSRFFIPAVFAVKGTISQGWQRKLQQQISLPVWLFMLEKV